MLTIYLKALSAAFRQTMGDLWGVLWRPRHTLQEIYERGTWVTSLVLLLIGCVIKIPRIGMSGIVMQKIGFHGVFDLYMLWGIYNLCFLFGFLATLLMGIKLYTKAGQWHSFLRIAGYCIVPTILNEAISLFYVPKRAMPATQCY